MARAAVRTTHPSCDRSPDRARHEASTPSATGPNGIHLGSYARAQQEVYDEADPYEYDEQWRPNPSATVHVAWLNAILAGHAKVEEGLAIDAPALRAALGAIDRSRQMVKQQLTRVDSVLERFDRVARAALKLGASVTIEADRRRPARHLPVSA